MKLAIVAGEKARREPQENPGVARSLRFLQGAGAGSDCDAEASDPSHDSPSHKFVILPKLVILSEAKDLLFAGSRRSLALLGNERSTTSFLGTSRSRYTSPEGRGTRHPTKLHAATLPT
jgi:hypothetical protein